MNPEKRAFIAAVCRSTDRDEWSLEEVLYRSRCVHGGSHDAGKKHICRERLLPLVDHGERV
jgi:hypothetical protein